MPRSDDPRPTSAPLSGAAIAAAMLVSSLLSTAAVGAGSPASGANATAEAERAGLQVVPISTQHWVGVNDVLFEVFDAAGRPLAPADVPLRFSLTPPGADAPHDALPVIARFGTLGRTLYRARVALDVVGPWRLTTTTLDGSRRSGGAWLEVWPDLGTPPLGAAVPGGATPTLREAGSLLRAVSSDPEPLAAFYVSSLDEALANGQPLAFVVDSYAFRPNAACGGALGILHEIFIEYPALTVIHAEPWRMRFSEGLLTLDPPGGPAVLADWSRAWGVSEPPWVFVVDQGGRLRAKFTGVMGTDELRAALDAVTDWRSAG